MEFTLEHFARLAVILTAMPIHEFAHAYVATKLGDDTPRLSGRLTLNPLHHIDILGAIMIMLVGIGYAKPVSVNPYNMKGNRKTAMALTAVAGPVSNILLAFILLTISKILSYSIFLLGFSSFVGNISIIADLLWFMVSINISLAVFNLLPIYPLDGSKILAFFLPEHIERKIEENSMVLYLGLFAVLFTGILDKPIFFLTRYVMNGLDFATKFVDIIFTSLI